MPSKAAGTKRAVKRGSKPAPRKLSPRHSAEQSPTTWLSKLFCLVILPHKASQSGKQDHHQLYLLVSKCKLGDQHLKKLLSTEIPIHFPHAFSYHFRFKQHSSPKSLPPSLVLNYTSPLLHNTDSVLLIKRLKLYPTISEIQTLACHQMKEWLWGPQMTQYLLPCCKPH